MITTLTPFQIIGIFAVLNVHYMPYVSLLVWLHLLMITHFFLGGGLRGWRFTFNFILMFSISFQLMVYFIYSDEICSDGETFISADDLRINLWNLEISNQSFNIVDVKPANMEDLTGTYSQIILCYCQNGTIFIVERNLFYGNSIFGSNC
jgi:hypothetical protein